MTLSNTAVPKYYRKFRDEVVSGKIPVCREIIDQMNRIDADILNPEFYYDDEAIDGFVRFCENELTLTDGSPLKLLSSFKLWAEDLLSWFYFVDRSVYIPGIDGKPGHYEQRRIKKRLRNKQYLEVARSNAKSLYETAIQAYFLACDRSTMRNITVAPTMKQADEVISPLRTAMVRARGPYFKMVTDKHLTFPNVRSGQALFESTKQGIENHATGSLLEIRPMSIDKLQGLRTKVSTVDEWLSGDIREDPIGAIEQGAAKINDYVIVAVSSEGTVRNGIGDSIKMELKSILRGDYINPHVSIFMYKLDDIHEVPDPDMWMKASPNLGMTVSYETYQQEVERAEKVPSTRNDILAKRFGIPMEGYTYFFTYEETLPHRQQQFWNLPCAMGADLSQGDDFCSFTFMFPLGMERFGIKTRNYITSYPLSKLPMATRQKYEEFMDEGSLVIMDGTVLDMMQVYEDLDQFIEHSQYDVRSFGFDPYNAQAFVERWTQENGEFGVEKVIQGAKTESVPLGELKKLAEERSLIFDQRIMQYALGNCIALEDTNGNRKLYKRRREDKIDCVAAMLDAFVSYKLNRDAFE